MTFAAAIVGSLLGIPVFAALCLLALVVDAARNLRG